jgi:Zn finger protein HypA/HybF involved in hydrogenase expression
MPPHTIPQMDDFVHLVTDIATIYHAAHVETITVELGAHCCVEPAYFREEFQHSAANTLAADAEIVFITNPNPEDKHADDVTLLEIEVV